MRKFLALFFAFVLVFVMLPGMAAAEGDVTTEEESTEGVETPVEDGEPADEDGEPADEDGEPADEDGEPADEDGEPADEDGEPADEDGEPADEDGEPADEDGEPADEDGEPADEDGEPADEDGEPADDTDPGLLPDSPFYFLKTFVENIKIWFTFDEERKTDLLSELVEVRLAELEALEEKYADEDMTERQQSILDEAVEDLESAAEGLLQRLIGEGDDLENLELTEEDLAKLETALEDLGEAVERVADCDEEGDGEQLTKAEKYQKRIRHLEQIRDRNPEAAEKGLTRAIENAHRQQAKWEEKHGVAQDPTDGEDEEDEEDVEAEEDGLEVDENEEAENTQADLTDAKEEPDNGNGKDKTNNGKGNDMDKTNNGKGNDKDKTNNGKGNEKDKTNNGKGN